MENDEKYPEESPLYNQELFDFEKEGSLTVGRLKEILANLPDDWKIIIYTSYSIDEDGKVIDRQPYEVLSLDTHWHGAVTITEV